MYYAEKKWDVIVVVRRVISPMNTEKARGTGKRKGQTSVPEKPKPPDPSNTLESSETTETSESYKSLENIETYEKMNLSKPLRHLNLGLQ